MVSGVEKCPGDTLIDSGVCAENISLNEEEMEKKTVGFSTDTDAQLVLNIIQVQITGQTDCLKKTPPIECVYSEISDGLSDSGANQVWMVVNFL